MKTRQGVELLLTALGPDYVPTHWGLDERAPNPFDVEAVVAGVLGLPTSVAMPALHRRKSPRYQAYFTAKNQGLTGVKLEFSSMTSVLALRRVFELGARLASALKPHFGFVHPIWRLGDRSQTYSAIGILSVTEYAKFGPKGLCARTWIGPLLLDRITTALLRGSGAFVVQESWGGAHVDLVEEPWSAGFERLAQAQTRSMQHLVPAGVWSDHSVPYDPKPGPRWTALEEW